MYQLLKVICACCRQLVERLEKLEARVSEQVAENSLLLTRLKQVQTKAHPFQLLAGQLLQKPRENVAKKTEGEEVEVGDEVQPAEFSNDDIAVEEGDVGDHSRPVIPVLLFACNRYSLHRQSCSLTAWLAVVRMRTLNFWTSRMRHYLYGSGSFHKAKTSKKLRKALISTLL